ncbi:GNVR domain-containing protein [Imperialibacter roseus]|uniref:GNVR domain-containing protein n=1 Tax=Imperialibacter roseus TaxID=1324217 RepID=A0ABZ0IRC7_9BACT|nr:GNVR domain-containing protein [Imperialibacter roseus]WOK06276.1 GNVR domain-containing protein [Imperialibacter roseus]
MDYLQENDFDIRAFLIRFGKRWRWFALSFLILMVACLLFNRYSKPTYLVRSTLFIPEERKTAVNSALKEQDLFELSVNTENEIENLRSYTLINDVVGKLSGNVRYYKASQLGSVEIFTSESPFICEIIGKINIQSKETVSVELINESKFFLEYFDSSSSQEVILEASFGEELEIQGTSVRFTKTKKFNELGLAGRYHIEFWPLVNFTENVRARLRIKPINPKASILELTLSTSVPDKGIRLLNTLMDTYIKRELELKNEKANKTVKFIDEQLASIEKALFSSEEEFEAFRTRNKIFNISQEGVSIFSRLKSLEEEKAKLGMQLDYFNYLIDYLANLEPGSVASPSTAGISDAGLNNLVVKLNETGNSIIRVSSSASEINPQLTTLESQYSSLIDVIKENVRNLRNTTEIQLNDINSRVLLSEKELNRLPGNERQYINIQRNFNVNEGLYLYLLKERAEAGIAKASNEASSKVVDFAVLQRMTFPNKNINFVIAFILSFVLPLVIFSIRDFIKNTVQSQIQIEKETGLSVVGNLPHFKYSNIDIINTYPSTELAERFRILRSTLKSTEPTGRVSTMVLISSTGDNEGKTFTAFNLSSVFSEAGYKTLLLCMDYRKPPGLASFVDFKPLPVSELTSKHTLKYVNQSASIGGNLFVYSVRELPANPGQLMANEELRTFLGDLKNHFEYIVVDSSPIGHFADAFEIAKYADVSLFVVRANKTTIESLRILKSYVSKGLFKNISIVLNAGW